MFSTPNGRAGSPTVEQLVEMLSGDVRGLVNGPVQEGCWLHDLRPSHVGCRRAVEVLVDGITEIDMSIARRSLRLRPVVHVDHPRRVIAVVPMSPVNSDHFSAVSNYGPPW